VTPCAEIIGKRAAQELKEDDIVNIGVGIPETVTKYAKINGMLDKITLTVESGGVGGFPASGKVFGAVIGADSIYDMAISGFRGGMEVDQYGNVNAHKGPGAFAGVGGFANITAKTRTVVFCLTFDTKGLSVEEKDGEVIINEEGIYM
jgi:propionate CoA-transferase (EC 2.8.3.1)